jgi:hypothetical protein
MKRKLPLITFRLQNFNALQDSRIIKFIPLRFWLVFVK